MKLINNVLFMLLTVGMFSGCIKEDMDDCPKYSVNTLSLSYKGDGTTEIFNDKIEQVVMYVFDQNEKLVTTKVLTKEEYIDIVVTQLEYLRPEIVINRITGDPKESDLIEPNWLVKKFCVLNDIDKELVKRETYQGKKVIA